MKRLNLGDILYYGRTYDSKEQNFYFGISDQKVYDKDEMVQSYGFTEELLSDVVSLHSIYNYVPLFQVDIIALMTEFLYGMNNRQIFNDLKGLDAETLYIYFQRYMELHPYSKQRWNEYERDCLTEAAVKWCGDNDIPYII